ncbi:MAG: hypothetical protein ACE5ES_04825, partial [Candidatus Nanoarchaeia archaeon]
QIAETKIKTVNSLGNEHYYGKISLLYDSLRELLECLALSKGYKIYNHECYTSFLKEIVNKSDLGDEFDKFRILRNNINYYGKQIDKEEGVDFINKMYKYIEKIKQLLDKD